MNGLAHEPRRWSRPRWRNTVALAFLLQVGLLAWLGRGMKFQSTAPELGARLSLASDPQVARQIQAMPTFRDPTRFALPSLEGFSGSAWLRFTPLENTLHVWTAPDRWLEPDLHRLGQAFGRVTTTNPAPPLVVADKAILRITGTDIFVPNQPSADRSSLTIKDALAPRSPSVLPPLPSWPRNDILSNSVVQLTVLDSGESFSAVLLSASGDTEVDRYALRAATGLRFAPRLTGPDAMALSGPLDSGRLIFAWHTRPPDATNAALPAP